MSVSRPSPARRRLSHEELALWIEVTRTISPRPGSDRPRMPVDKPEKETNAPSQEEARPVLTQLEHVKPHKGAYKPNGLPLAPIERRLRQRLSRGQVDLDSKIDLHGMHQDEAHFALRRFLIAAQQNGAKVVLVVTGKGKPRIQEDRGIGDTPGILRRAAPQWLSAPDLRSVVLGFEEASQAHGGAGALYVRLRTKRPGALRP